jgi:hypothetical protein
MIELILEHEWIVLVIGIASSAISCIVALNTGQKSMLLAALACLALAFGGFALSRWIVTEKESIRTMVLETAQKLEKNQRTEVRAAFYANPSETIINASRALDFIVFETAEVKKIHEITVTGPPSARRATVAMNVFVQVKGNRFNNGIPRYVELTLYRKDGSWFVYDFTEADPMVGFQNRLKLDP